MFKEKIATSLLAGLVAIVSSIAAVHYEYFIFGGAAKSSVDAESVDESKDDEAVLNGQIAEVDDKGDTGDAAHSRKLTDGNSAAISSTISPVSEANRVKARNSPAAGANENDVRGVGRFEPNPNSGAEKCIAINADFQRHITLKRGDILCSEDGVDKAVILNITDNRLVFRVNDGYEVRCKLGEICGFRWSGRQPLFNIAIETDQVANKKSVLVSPYNK